MTEKMDEMVLYFEFNEAERDGKHLRFSDPLEVIEINHLHDVVPALDKIEAAVKSGLYAAGFVSYEAAPAFDSAMQICEKNDLPLLSFGIFRVPEIVDPADATAPGAFQIGTWQPNVGKSEYRSWIEKIKNEIKQGNTFQVNYTIRLKTDFTGDDFAFYKRLAKAQKGQYSAYLNMGRYRILSASPELFFNLRGETLTTRPMKGTIKRGQFSAEDKERSQSLFHSEKDRAENVMITDLLRNDLGRVAKFGSVRVSKLFEIEKYPTVYQMTSEIKAEVRPEVTLADLFRGLFPCGSVTGAPKISTMNIIMQSESKPRGVYCGAIGYLEPNGDATFSVPIRTVVIDRKDNTAEYGVGGGITWGSTSEAEYDEILAKAALLQTEQVTFDLLETILLDDGRYTFLERHLERMQASAEYFDYPFAIDEIKRILKEHSDLYPAQRRRIRLLLSEKGEARIESYPFAPLTEQVDTRVCLAAAPVDSKNLYLYHKTTNRGVYEAHKKMFPEAYDVLLWNESEEVTEFTTGNVVAELNGVKVTPPVSSGLLPGVFRQSLLDSGEIIERNISLQDIWQATRVWLINSVKGWVPVQIVKPADGSVS